MKINSLKMICTNYLGFKKVIELEPEMIKELEKMEKDELMKRLKWAADSYSKNYWVSMFLNDKKVYSVQWAEI